MFHDLNVPYIGPDDPEIGRTLAFLSERKYLEVPTFNSSNEKHIQ